MSTQGRYGKLCIAESVYPTPDKSKPDEALPMASDKPRWTEPPQGGYRAGLLGNVRFRLLFVQRQGGRRWR